MIDALNSRPRVSLLGAPTPIERLDRLEAVLGAAAGDIRLYMKRDDLAGIGGGGNKLRKLEFLLGEALAQGCDTFITTGGLQSNHARLMRQPPHASACPASWFSPVSSRATMRSIGATAMCCSTVCSGP